MPLGLELKLLTLLIASIFIGIHLFARQLHQGLYRSKQVAGSFGSGLAIAYVFIQLLPELEKGADALGHLRIENVKSPSLLNGY